MSSSSGVGSGDSGGISKTQIKERFKNFTLTFEDLCQRQSQWTIPDNELREAVRLQIEEVLLPAYRSFLKRYSSAIENGKIPNKYVKYTAEDLERMIGELFEGKSRSEQRRY
jgi:exocyst complex protein 7